MVGLKLVPQEEIAEAYPPHEHPGEQQVIAELVDESGTRFTRARLFKLGLLGAGGTLGLALLTPAASFGPLFHVGDFLRTPWRRGRRLVDENGRPYKASDIEQNDFYLAFPEGTNDEEKEQMAASLVVIRLPPDQLRRFRDWFAEFEADRFDQQIERDAKAGRLDQLAEQALADYRAGRAREL